MCMDIISQLAENMDKKLKEVEEIIGIEKDWSVSAILTNLFLCNKPSFVIIKRYHNKSKKICKNLLFIIMQ